MTRLLRQTDFFKQRKVISVCHDTSEYNLDDPDYLPPFWKYKVIVRKDGRTDKQYLSPHGVTVRLFVAVTEYLLACALIIGVRMFFFSFSFSFSFLLFCSKFETPDFGHFLMFSS